jgi:predicted DNA-binding transcriptional regulator AlpA
MNFLTLEEVSQKFGFNRQVWRRWVAAGKVKAHIEGRAWVIEESEARAWAESRKAPEARREPGSVNMAARRELQKDSSRSNIEIARLVGASPSAVSVERRKLGLPRLPHGGMSKAPPGWTGQRKPKA